MHADGVFETDRSICIVIVAHTRQWNNEIMSGDFGIIYLLNLAAPHTPYVLVHCTSPIFISALNGVFCLNTIFRNWIFHQSWSLWAVATAYSDIDENINCFAVCWFDFVWEFRLYRCAISLLTISWHNTLQRKTATNGSPLSSTKDCMTIISSACLFVCVCVSDSKSICHRTKEIIERKKAESHSPQRQNYCLCVFFCQWTAHFTSPFVLLTGLHSLIVVDFVFSGAHTVHAVSTVECNFQVCSLFTFSFKRYYLSFVCAQNAVVEKSEQSVLLCNINFPHWTVCTYVTLSNASRV